MDPEGNSEVYRLHRLEAVEVLLLGVVQELREGWHSGLTEFHIETLLVEDCNESLDTVRD